MSAIRSGPFNARPEPVEGRALGAGPPLQGVRVLDLTRLLPGAYATLLLADLGADVIKIEDPRGGDGMRTLDVRPTAARASDADPVSYFELLNRNKRSVTLDLRSPEAAAVLDALAARSDVIVDSFRPSTARRLKVDGETLLARHPGLICASINGFGLSGPDAERAAHDINYQALAGLLFARGSTGSPRAGSTGSPRAETLALSPSKGEPHLPDLLIGDISAAMQAAIGILAALIARQQTGTGTVVDVSIHGAAASWSVFPTTAELMSACYTLYETADGEWLALGALEAKFWKGFCERIGRPDLVPLQHAPGEERTRLLNEVRAIMRGRTRDEWLAHFAGADVCLTPVLAYRSADAVAERPVRLKADATYDHRPAPKLGADTDAVLEEAGIEAAERARLRSAGAI